MLEAQRLAIDAISIVASELQAVFGKVFVHYGEVQSDFSSEANVCSRDGGFRSSAESLIRTAITDFYLLGTVFFRFSSYLYNHCCW